MKVPLTVTVDIRMRSVPRAYVAHITGWGALGDGAYGSMWVRDVPIEVEGLVTGRALLRQLCTELGLLVADESHEGVDEDVDQDVLH